MKLTNMMRDAYISQVLKDTPTTDIEVLRQKACAIAIEDALTRAPAEVKKLWKSNTLRPWVTTRYHPFRGNLGHSVYLPAIPGSEKLSNEAQSKVDELDSQALAALTTKDALRSKLRAVAYSCATRKQLADALPEFEKYLPADEAKAVRSLPVVTNVVADFVKAGWPKGGANAKA